MLNWRCSISGLMSALCLQNQLDSSLTDVHEGDTTSANSGSSAVPSVGDMLCDSFLKHLLKQFFCTLDEATHPLLPALQVRKSTVHAGLLKRRHAAQCSHSGRLPFPSQPPASKPKFGMLFINQSFIFLRRHLWTLCSDF